MAVKTLQNDCVFDVLHCISNISIKIRQVIKLINKSTCHILRNYFTHEQIDKKLTLLVDRCSVSNIGNILILMQQTLTCKYFCFCNGRSRTIAAFKQAYQK